MRVEDKTRAASVRQGEAASDGKLRASMNGRVVSVMVGVGDIVRTGQPIITLEAMKMEHVHAAPISGKVIALHVGTGDQIAASRVVAEIEVALPG
jgi:geranyl-CoA carboxylase alpha subunit